jgi:hypothetical protein
LLRNFVWVAAGAFMVGLGIFAWILVSAGYFGSGTQEKQGPETTLSPRGNPPAEAERTRLRQ